MNKHINYQSILDTLLNTLKVRQSWCPLCYGEHCCQFDCDLKDLWFEKRRDYYEQENE